MKIPGECAGTEIIFSVKTIADNAQKILNPVLGNPRVSSTLS